MPGRHRLSISVSGIVQACLSERVVILPNSEFIKNQVKSIYMQCEDPNEDAKRDFLVTVAVLIRRWYGEFN